jgi:ArsR family transcriptional regulator
MDIENATRAFDALSQKTRLQTFKLLVHGGPAGMPAGRIAEELNVPHNTLSSHLSILANAGLITSRRQGRSIIYSIDFEGTRELISFLTDDCCQGRPELCATLTGQAAAR